MILLLVGLLGLYVCEAVPAIGLVEVTDREYVSVRNEPTDWMDQQRMSD